MTSIYLHIPVCRRICGYCDFFRSARIDRLPQLLDRMWQELEKERGFLSSTLLNTIYFGGGTPSLLTPRQIEGLLERIHALYDTSQLEEITLEANPDDLSLDYLRAIRSIGINRLSIGIQSFDDEVLKLMNRRHSAKQAVEAIENARKAGFDNVAADLIFGIADYGAEVLSGSISQLVDLSVEHIAAYHLTIESGTAFERKLNKGEMRLVDEEVSEREFLLIREKLLEAGYEHYEVSNYAKPGRRSRHNSSYWQGDEYLGIGAGAHSFAGNERRWTAGSIEDYLSSNSRKERYESEFLSTEDRRREMIMTRLRCADGLSLDEFEREFGENATKKLLIDSKKFIENKEIKLFNNNMQIYGEYMLRSDMMIEALF